MKKTISREVDVEVCDKCGDELFDYGHGGRIPHHIYGVVWGDDDEAFCSRKCLEALHPDL